MTYLSCWVPGMCQSLYDPESKCEYHRQLTWKLDPEITTEFGIEALVVWPRETVLWIAQQYEMAFDATHFRTTAEVLRAIAEEFYTAIHDDHDYRSFMNGDDDPTEEEQEAIEELVAQVDTGTEASPSVHEAVIEHYLRAREVLDEGQLRARDAAARICPLPIDTELLAVDQDGYVVHSDDGIELAQAAECLEADAGRSPRARVMTIDFPARAVEKYGVRGVRFCVRDFLVWQASRAEHAGLFDECVDEVAADLWRSIARKCYGDWADRVVARRAYYALISDHAAVDRWSEARRPCAFERPPAFANSLRLAELVAPGDQS
jgi:hypothetical protein